MVAWPAGLPKAGKTSRLATGNFPTTKSKNIPENQTVVFGNCMPCTNCQKYLAKFGFKKIKYTDYINNENVLHELKLIQ